MKVYCDAIEWYPFFELDELPDSCGDTVELELTAGEWANYTETMELFNVWQDRLREMVRKATSP